MAQQKSPHTQSEQNEPVTQIDLEPGELEQMMSTGDDACTYRNNEGAQTGGNRSARHGPRASVKRNVEPAVQPFEGPTTGRTNKNPDEEGAANRSSAMENEGPK